MDKDCPNCHSQNPEDSSYCSTCGTRLKSDEESPPLTQSSGSEIQHLAPGSILLDQYEIIEELGKGGMGVVYRAKDNKLEREVAIKVLPNEFAQDRDRLSRFKREAKMLASLNHPGIAAIYGLETAGAIHFIILELVKGKTLSEMEFDKSLDLEEILDVFHQISEALEAAHDRGIIHRDLKPANIMVSSEGKVKVLDFGLAKAFEASVSGESAGVDLSKSPTKTLESNRSGMILGTAAYMSPEQARGKPLDKRTDIWSFGCVLFEALSGKKVFKGETISDSIAAILKNEPDWKALPETTPAKIKDLIRRCLQKNPHSRLHDIADARIEIEDALSGNPVEVPLVSRSAAKLKILPWVLTGLFFFDRRYSFFDKPPTFGSRNSSHKAPHDRTPG